MDWTNPLIFSVAKIVAISVAFLAVMLLVALTVLAERRVLAFIQGRVGPNRVGYFGVLQPFADFIKTMVKEDLVPDQSTKFVFLLAPMIAVVTAIMAIVVYPFGPAITLPFLGNGSAGHCALRCRLALCVGCHVGWCLRHRARRLVFKQQVQPDGWAALVGADDFL